MINKKAIYFSKIIFIYFCILFTIIGCKKSKESSVSGVLSGDATILSGDSTDLIFDLKGTPPFAIRYLVDGVITDRLGIMSSPYLVRVAPTKDTSYEFEAVTTYYQNIGQASGSASIKVLPVKYILDQTISAKMSGFIHSGTGVFTINPTELQTRKQNPSTGNDRFTFLEFDASEISNFEEKNRYTLSFWLVKTHPTTLAVGPGTFEMTGILGGINNTWNWTTQPSDDSLTALSTVGFTATTATQQIKLEGDITKIVNDALKVSDKKFTIRIKEIKNSGFYYLASQTYSDVTKRPVVEVKLRRSVD